MSAREKLIRFAKHNEPNDGTGVPIDPETGHMVMDVEAHVAGMLDDFAREVAEQQRGLMVYELDWAPGNYQWQCPRCRAIGNVTPAHVKGSGPWHTCRPKAHDGAGLVRPDEEPTT